MTLARLPMLQFGVLHSRAPAAATCVSSECAKRLRRLTSEAVGYRDSELLEAFIQPKGSSVKMRCSRANTSASGSVSLVALILGGAIGCGSGGANSASAGGSAV